MRIIGIKLKSGEPEVIKNLHEGMWYPFGDYVEPTESNPFPWAETRVVEKTLSQLYKSVDDTSFSDSFKLSVSCVVGKNGSGKTTLLELLMRIINNFVIHVLKNSNKIELPTSLKLSEAGGFAADLYFETDDVFGKVGYDFGNVSYTYISEKNRNNVSDDQLEILLEDGKFKHVLSGFFYTICSNYSIYSFNQNDYESKRISIPEGKDKVNGKWLRGLLHKNDGYLTPIVITPYRDEGGNIDVANERDLADLRLSTLSLLFYSQGKVFLNKYKPYYIEYRFDDMAATKFQARLFNLCAERIPINIQQHKIIFTSLLHTWEKVLSARYSTSLDFRNPITSTVVTYLVYKTLKICLNYVSFGELLGAHPLTKEQVKQAKDLWDREHRKWYDDAADYMSYLTLPSGWNEKVVEKIMNDKSHITLKIQQIFECIDRDIINAFYAKVDSDEYLTSVKRIHAKEFLERNYKYDSEQHPDKTPIQRYEKYDDVYRLLPPPIFQWDLYYEEKGAKDFPQKELMGGFSLKSLSSGEKQILNSISYIIYHIKNIESVQVDKYRHRYHHINVILDEVELYYHPDYQRKLLASMIQMLSWSHIDARKIRSVNIIMVTHSPFVLSDVPQNRIIYLEGGVCKPVNTETFSSNIHELLYNQFYIHSPIGEVADMVERKIITFYNKKYNKTGRKSKEFARNIPYFKKVVGMIGEPYVQNMLMQMLNSIEDKLMDCAERRKSLEEEKKSLEERLSQINAQLMQ